MTTCIHCGADSEDVRFRSLNVCHDCYLERCRQTEKRNKERRYAAMGDDPIVRPASVTKTLDDCRNCAFITVCRNQVMAGKQILCLPTRESDVLLEAAYVARREL